MTTPATTPSTPPPRAHSRAVRAHTSLLPYVLALIGATAVLHLLITLSDNRITVLTTLPLVVIALGYAIYLVTLGRPLGQVRYGHLVAHALTYAVVNVGYLLHAFVLIASDSPAVRGDGHFALEAGWFGATFGMAAFWGIGLILHGLGALLDRGFEAPRA